MEKAEEQEYKRILKQNKSLQGEVLKLRDKFKKIGELCQVGMDLQELEKENENLKSRLKPFKDECFKGLKSEDIAALAKKSIRITSENCKLTHTLEDVRDIADLIANCICNQSTEAEKIVKKINEVLKDV